jgi:Fe-S oxidoreductase
VIATLIATLMVTFLSTFAVEEASGWGRLNWWTHMLVLLAFMALIPASKHLHLVLSPVTVFLKSRELGLVKNLDFDREEVGLEMLADLSKKTVLDAFTCVDYGRCQSNCPAWGAGKELNPKALILQTQQALLSGPRDRKLLDIYSEAVLWQCTTCGACENQCPVGVAHVPLIVGSRRGLVSNGEAPSYLGSLFNNLDRWQNVWGLGYNYREKSVRSSQLETFDSKKHEWRVERVTFHDPCYLGRYAGTVDEPRALLTRYGGEVYEPERTRTNPYCCGAGGGLFFADKEEKPGTRISDVRFGQLKATGATTIMTACPFCSIMLKGAKASASAGTAVQFVDLMTFVKDRLLTSPTSHES